MLPQRIYQASNSTAEFREVCPNIQFEPTTYDGRGWIL